MGEHGGSGFRIGRAAAGVVAVKVRQDREANREGRAGADLGDERVGGLRARERIDHEDRLGAHHEAAVSVRGILRSARDGGEDPGRDLRQREWSRGRHRRLSACEPEQRGEPEQEHDHARDSKRPAV